MRLEQEVSRTCHQPLCPISRANRKWVHADIDSAVSSREEEYQSNAVGMRQFRRSSETAPERIVG